MTNTTMNLQLFAEPGEAVTPEQLTKAREVDFVNRFSDGVLKGLLEALGVERAVALQEGTTLYVTRTEGTLEDGAVAEGAVIPLSEYKRVREPVGEIAIRKWRKATTAEAIEREGYGPAVRETDRALMEDVQKAVRAEFFSFLTSIVKPAEGTDGEDGYVPAAGVSFTADTMQAVLARSWGELQVLFGDDAVQTVHFINPLTVSEYLSTAPISMNKAFGMNYVSDFLGLGTVVMSSQIPRGEVYSTATKNLVLYYLNMNGGDLSEAMRLTADDTGFIGIRSGYPVGERAQVESLVMSGVRCMVVCADGVVKGKIRE